MEERPFKGDPSQKMGKEREKGDFSIDMATREEQISSLSYNISTLPFLLLSSPLVVEHFMIVATDGCVASLRRDRAGGRGRHGRMPRRGVGRGRRGRRLLVVLAVAVGAGAVEPALE